LRLGIIANTKKYDITNFLVDFINKHHEKHKIILSKETYLFIKSHIKENHLSKLINILPEEQFKGKIDLLLSFGGDGTMLFSAQFAVEANALLAGVNFGKLGFLADISFSELDALLEEIEKNKFDIEQRILIEGKITGKKKNRLLAINDIVIEKGGWSRIIEIDVYVNKKFLTTYRADGLIISTPTGSTAYSLSTGGPILLPQLDAILLSPICPHTLTVRPIVIPSDSLIEIEARSGYETVMVNKDGQLSWKLRPPLKMEIKKSKKVLRLIKRKNKDYFNTLREKLMWGLDIREQQNNMKGYTP